MCKKEQHRIFQDWAIDLFTSVLENKSKHNLEEYGYKYSLKNGVVCHYASMYWNGEEYINLWQTSFNFKRAKRNNGCEKPLLMSISAYKIIKDMLENNRPVRENKKTVLHWEHITPNSVVYKKLLSLKDITKEKVTDCFRHHKLVIITKDESTEYLDGKQFYSKEDIEILSSWQDKLGEVFSEDIDSIKGEHIKCKDCGTGLARIAHLWNKGVRFTKYESGGREYTYKEIFEYLEDTDFSYEKV